MRNVVTAWVVLIAIACVDVQDGEMGFYASPCGTIWRAALLCDRENGGADPNASGTAPSGGGGGDGMPQPDTSCEAVCDLLAGCVGITDPAQIAECVIDCQQQSTPAQRECIIMNGCNFEMCEVTP